jgi:hypothetical protein
MIIVYYDDIAVETSYVGKALSPVSGCMRERPGMVHIQVDGDELERVIRWGYPVHGSAVQTYVGDNALQIIANW